MEVKIEQKLEDLKNLLQSLRPTFQEYFSLQEAAMYLKITKSTLYKHTSAGNIAHFKPNGKMILFEKKDLDGWLNRCRIPSNAELLKH